MNMQITKLFNSNTKSITKEKKKGTTPSNLKSLKKNNSNEIMGNKV